MVEGKATQEQLLEPRREHVAESATNVPRCTPFFVGRLLAAKLLAFAPF
jgi:hypothetical protein